VRARWPRQDGTVVVGGRNNVAGQSETIDDGQCSAVLGGCDNFARGEGSVVGGGQGNVATGKLSSVSGGKGNVADKVRPARWPSQPTENIAISDNNVVASHHALEPGFRHCLRRRQQQRYRFRIDRQGMHEHGPRCRHRFWGRFECRRGTQQHRQRRLYGMSKLSTVVRDCLRPSSIEF
jgi:hypothetical protein